MAGVGPYQFERTRCDSFRAFGHFPQDEGRDAKGGRFFLNPARISEDECGVFHQVDKR